MPVPSKRRRRTIIWILVPLFVVCFGFFLVDAIGMAYPLTLVIGDAMDWKSHYLAGLRSVNCGRVKVREDASLATRCALQADAAGKPFRVSYNIQGIDSIVAGGVVRTPGGKLLALSYDSCPSGCGFSMLQQRVHVASCPEPYHLHVNPKGRINCFQSQVSSPRNIMSPNMEPY